MKQWLQRLRHFPWRDRSLAATGERHVVQYLRRRGYRVLARNLRNRCGEIDIVAEAPDGRTIVIVEVKSSARADTDPPPEARVHGGKQRKLVALAGQLVRRHRLDDRPVRFDVAAVEAVGEGRPVIRYHVGAFESHV